MVVCSRLFVTKSERRCQLQVQSWYFFFLTVFVPEPQKAVLLLLLLLKRAPPSRSLVPVGAAGAGGGLLRLLHDEPAGGSSEGTPRPLSQCVGACVRVTAVLFGSSGDLLAPGFHVAIFHTLLPELLPTPGNLSGRVNLRSARVEDVRPLGASPSPYIVNFEGAGGCTLPHRNEVPGDEGLLQGLAMSSSPLVQVPGFQASLHRAKNQNLFERVAVRFCSSRRPCTAKIKPRRCASRRTRPTTA